MRVEFDRIWGCGACVRGDGRISRSLGEVMKGGGSRSLDIHASQGVRAGEKWLALVLYNVVCWEVFLSVLGGTIWDRSSSYLY